MNRWLAIVTYRCEVAGVPTDSLDIQVRYFEAESAEEVESRLYNETESEYTNPYGQLVTWPLACVVTVEPFSQAADGDEVIGFIAGVNQFVDWTREDDSQDGSVLPPAEEGQ